MTIRRTAVAAAAGLALLLLAACSREPDAPPPADERVEEPEVAEPAPAPAAPPPVVEAPPAPSLATEANFEEPPEEPVDPSDQTLEDADATGLTTRANRSDDEKAQPADEEAQGGQGL